MHWVDISGKHEQKEIPPEVNMIGLALRASRVFKHRGHVMTLKNLIKLMESQVKNFKAT